ncbi:hypothetical protein GY45DRAFT_1327644 [Cubamyces sp. BRFM 1775]|nr:hypothetical protein GY45DRAFT_1327644 [Cubamyces sp. BRFM 1775]
MAHHSASLRISPLSLRQDNSTSASNCYTTTSSATSDDCASAGVPPSDDQGSSTSTTDPLTTTSSKVTTSTSEVITTSTPISTTTLVPISVTVLSKPTTISSSPAAPGPSSAQVGVISSASVTSLPGSTNVVLSSTTSSVAASSSSIDSDTATALLSDSASSTIPFFSSEPITTTTGSLAPFLPPTPTGPYQGASDPVETSSPNYTASTTLPTLDQPASQSSSTVHASALTIHVATIVGICFAILIVLVIGALCIFQWRKRRQATTAAKPYMTNRNTLGGESFRALRLSGESRMVPDMSLYPSLPPPTLDVRTSTGIYNFPIPPSRAMSDARATPENANLLSLLISYYDTRSPSRNSYVSQDESSLPSDIMDASAEPMDWAEPSVLPRASSELMRRGSPNASQTSLPSDPDCDLPKEEDVYCAI